MPAAERYRRKHTMLTQAARVLFHANDGGMRGPHVVVLRVKRLLG